MLDLTAEHTEQVAEVAKFLGSSLGVLKNNSMGYWDIENWWNALLWLLLHLFKSPTCLPAGRFTTHLSHIYYTSSSPFGVLKLPWKLSEPEFIELKNWWNFNVLGECHIYQPSFAKKLWRAKKEQLMGQSSYAKCSGMPAFAWKMLWQVKRTQWDIENWWNACLWLLFQLFQSPICLPFASHYAPIMLPSNSHHYLIHLSSNNINCIWGLVLFSNVAECISQQSWFGAAHYDRI